MPEQDEPQWPSDDADSGSGDSGKTAELPVREITPESDAGVAEATAQVSVVSWPKAAEGEKKAEDVVWPEAAPEKAPESGNGSAEGSTEEGDSAEPEAEAEEPEAEQDASDESAEEQSAPEEVAEPEPVEESEAAEQQARAEDSESGDERRPAAEPELPGEWPPAREEAAAQERRPEPAAGGSEATAQEPVEDPPVDAVAEERTGERQSGGEAEVAREESAAKARERPGALFQPEPQEPEPREPEQRGSLFRPGAFPQQQAPWARPPEREPADQESETAQFSLFQPVREPEQETRPHRVPPPLPEQETRPHPRPDGPRQPPRQAAPWPPPQDGPPAQPPLPPRRERPPRPEPPEMEEPTRVDLPVFRDGAAPPERPGPRVPPPIPVAPHAQPMRIEPSGELRPAEATTGEAEEDRPQPPAEPEAARPRRKRRGLLIGALILVVVVAAGVTLALPAVSNRLALPWAPNAPKGDPPKPVAITRSLHAPGASAPTPTANGVAAALAGPAANPALGTLTGSVVDPATGTALWEKNPAQALTPASTTKLLTVSAALLALDHGKQLSTKVVAGTEPGSVVIVGGGDPTLSSLPAGKDSVYPGAAHLDDLVNQVRQAAGGAVKKVQVDVSAFKGPVTANGWSPGDAPQYTANVVPLMLDGGLTNPTDDHSVRVTDPAGTLAQKFAERLGATVAPQLTTTAPPGAKVLGEVKSAPITELARQLLQASDNLLADELARQTAIATGNEPSFAGAAKATMNVLAQNGFDLTGVQLHDGSGLSAQNKVPAKLLSQLLAAAAAPDGKDPKTVKLRPLLEGLPVAGGSGTLSGRYGDPSSAKGKGWVRGKTGTLSGVNTLAGVVLDTDGRVLVFALMSAGSEQDSGRAALDAVAAALRGCGCR
ncbi:D-alanyl-D-alanine carboxypeptidase/D-alanyl-D-alanine endopeptidase [Amycolatopsis anabasis]|uniref:D-alanyl-D-alanine carboxypeptidase/D-alanyl-D-alanine endopeptidase n=1 Tax=Amycolatopsis anabasis TaxID=1840409 RepID=UPI0031B5DB2C